MKFSNLAYAKLKLSFDKSAFIEEYDSFIFPRSNNISNGKKAILNSIPINLSWKMVDPEIYLKTDMFTQPRDITTRKHHKGEHPAWMMYQMMELDLKDVNDPLMIKYASFGGSALRNATLDKTFFLKKECRDLKIAKWVFDTLPFKKINSIHCVSIEPNGFGAIHRDSISLHNSNVVNGLGSNNLYKQGFVIININISNGGVPLYWSLDDDNFQHAYQSDDDVYLTNDYFYHGIPLCSSRRRQVRVTGIPEDKMFDLFDRSSIISIPDNYNYRENDF